MKNDNYYWILSFIQASKCSDDIFLDVETLRIPTPTEQAWPWDVEWCDETGMVVRKKPIYKLHFEWAGNKEGTLPKDVHFVSLQARKMIEKQSKRSFQKINFYWRAWGRTTFHITKTEHKRLKEALKLLKAGKTPA